MIVPKLASSVTVALLLTSAIMLSGCVTARECDPRRTNVFTAAACEGTGAAQKREELKEAQATAAERRVAELRAEIASLRSEATVRNKERMSLEHRIDELDKSLTRLRGVLAKARFVQGVNQARLAALQRDLAKLEAQRLSRTPQSTAEIKRLEEESEVIYEEIDALLGVTAS